MNKPTDKTKRIGIDARFYGPEHKGLGRYTKEVVDGITRQDAKNDYVVFLRSDNFDKFTPAGPNVKKVRADIRWYTLKEQLVLPYLIWREKLDFVHFLHFNVPLLTPAKFIVTIHDLILTRHPTRRASTLSPCLYWLKNRAYRIIISAAVRRSEYVIAVSDFTRQDIIEKFKIKAGKVVRIYEGVSRSLAGGKKDDKEVILRYNIHRPYLLYVGNAYPHKNLLRLLNVFSKVKDKITDLQLVLVGKEDYFYERLKRSAGENRFCRDMIFAGFVPDDDLPSFYRRAEAYVFPSLFEGFGLPPLEAMSQGCAVLSSDKACLPEILGQAACYFDPEDEEAMARAIIGLLESKEARAELVKAGHAQVGRYSWEQGNQAIIGLYEKINPF